MHRSCPVLASRGEVSQTSCVLFRPFPFGLGFLALTAVWLKKQSLAFGFGMGHCGWFAILCVEVSFCFWFWAGRIAGSSLFVLRLACFSFWCATSGAVGFLSAGGPGVLRAQTPSSPCTPITPSPTGGFGPQAPRVFVTVKCSANKRPDRSAVFSPQGAGSHAKEC